MTLYGVLFKAQSGDTELDPQNNEKLPVSLTEGKVRYDSCHPLNRGVPVGHVCTKHHTVTIN